MPDLKVQKTLEDIRKKEEIIATNEFKIKLAQEREIARRIQREELEKSTYQVDEKGNKTTDWQAALHKALQVINQDQAAFNDWRNAMSSLLNMFSLLNKAVHGSVNKHLTQPATNFLVDKVILGGIKDSFIQPPSEITLPSLEHNVQFTDDNRLNIEPIVRSDHPSDHPSLAEAAQDLQEAFTAGIVCWLKDNGYTKVPGDDMIFVNSRGQPLDKDTFYDLKADPYHGLAVFLSGDEPNLTFRSGGPR